MVRLVISDHEGSTTVVPLLRDEVTIGRKEGNTIRLTERNISRRHLQLVRIGGIYKLRDLDSYNGVLVNGRKVEGETQLNNGDQIQLGDYTILVEEDLSARAAPQQPHEPAAAASVSRRPAVPARLVMLTQPASGAEFVLPTDRPALLGRSDDVDCPINHRSVSREHASIAREGEHFVIEDRGSANGVTVNGRQVKSVALRSGDIIELGQVVFRFVAAGEHYFFDPGEASRYRVAGGRGNSNTRLAVLLGAVTVAVLVFLLLPTPDVQPQPDPDLAGLEPQDPRYGLGDGLHALPEAQNENERYDNAVLACRSALASMRIAEAAAHASMALKIRPSSVEALDCKQRADAQSMEEQVYVRGKDALARNDVELAYAEFAKLPETSAFRERSEIAQAANELARVRLAEGRTALSSNRAETARLAQSVLGLRGVSADQVVAAQQLLAEARKEKEASPQKPAAVAAARPPKPVASESERSSAPPPRPASSLVAPSQQTDARATTHVATNSAKAPGGAMPMEIANACLARGDNECVVHALEGSANTAQEIALLIETYRTIGDVRQAQKYMNTYVQRFPSDKRSDGYRRLLDLQKH